MNYYISKLHAYLVFDMKDIVVNKDKIDFEKFVKKTLSFLSTRVSDEVDPSMAIAIVEELGEEGYAVYGPESGWSNFIEKLEDGKLLFFPFSSPNTDQTIFITMQIYLDSL